MADSIRTQLAVLHCTREGEVLEEQVICLIIGGSWDLGFFQLNNFLPFFYEYNQCETNRFMNVKEQRLTKKKKKKDTTE